MRDAPLDHGLADGPSGGRALFVTASDGLTLRVAHWPGGRNGTVFLFPGRTEMVEKYGRAARDLAERGFATIVIDWRGQGLSDRAPGHPMIGHVAQFAHYQRDVQAMLHAANNLGLEKPYHLLSHSMGGTIALRSLYQSHPFASAAFSAPMWGLLIKPQMRAVAVTVSSLARISRQSHRLTPSTSLHNYLATAGFHDNVLTRDPDMFGWMQVMVQKRPELSLGGPSLGWLHAAMRECAALARLPSPPAAAICALGTAERVVASAPIHARMARWPNGRLDLYQNAEHEIMMETPDHRARFFDTIAEWFDAHR